MRVFTTISIAMMLILLTVSEGSSQSVILQAAFGGQSYGKADNAYGSANFKIGYEFENSLALDFSIVGSQASYDIRMPDITVSSTNWVGVIFNILTVSNTANWSKKERKEVYKRYFRNSTSFNLTVGKVVHERFKWFAGPSIRRNSINTIPTDEETYSGKLFSELEFDNYTNYGLVGGLDYRHPVSSWFYLLLNLEAQFDLLSTSNKVSGSDFISNSASFGLGIGLRFH